MSSTSAPAILPADASWIPRLIQEMQPAADTDSPTGQGYLAACIDQWLAWSRLTTQPWVVWASLWSMANLAAVHEASLESDWREAWWYFFTGRAPATGP